MKIKLRKGLDVVLNGVPEQRIRVGDEIARVALLGRDFPGVRPDLKVREGDRVRAGDVLFVDRRRPEIRFTAPAAGVVEAIRMGHRRSFDMLVIRREGDDTVAFAVPAAGDRQAIRDLLLASGSWTALRTRPFGRLPDPGSAPAAIFVTALDTDPLCADARIVLEPQLDAFERGLATLARLTEGPVFVCQGPGPDLATADARLRIVTFEGRHPAGLPGTHIHHLMPASANRTVWHVGHQDVASIGFLMETGQPRLERTVALGGSGARRPGLVTTRLGASLDDLLAAETNPGAMRILSGSVLSGRPSAYLGRYHTQVSILPDPASAPSGRRHGVRPRTPSVRLLDRLLDRLPRAGVGATIPIERLDEVLPLDILPVPLMRALAIGDVETAEALGCLELVEEDLALLSWLCPGRADYGSLLRRTLDELEGVRA